MKRFNLFLSLLLIIVLHSQIYAQHENENSKRIEEFSPGWALAIKASSMGFGGEVIKSFSEKFNLRLGGSYFKQKYSYTFAEGFDTKALNYTTVGSVTLIADWQFIDWMHLSGGVLYNFTELEIESKLSEAQKIGDIDVTPETIGSIYYRLNPNEICPYLGLGFGRTISKNKIVSFNFDFGAVYQGSPNVTLRATGMVSPTANEDQRKILEDNVKEYNFFPFISFQLSFRIL